MAPDGNFNPDAPAPVAGLPDDADPAETADASAPIAPAAPVQPGAVAPVARCPVCLVPASPSDAYCSRCGAALLANAAPERDPLLGAVIDARYRVMERLGQGGMGAVYLAEHVGIGKRVAVKVLRAHLRTQPELVRRFRREALVVSKLTDAHTITVFDFGIWEGLIYFVMEYLRGEDLGKVLEREGRLEPARALTIAHQICSSLSEAHTAGLVHRDLKPENVFLLRTSNGEEWVKVLDFGLAKTVRENPDLADPRGDATFQTAHGALLGTPYYMAPEQVKGDPVDGRTDLYALGALIYRMMTGDYPHTGRTPMQVLESHLSGIVRPVTETAPGVRVPEGAETLVRRMLAREQIDRPGTAGEVAEALMHISRRAASAESRAGAAAWQSATWQGEKPTVAAAPDGPTRDEVLDFERSLRLRTYSRLMLLLALLILGGVGIWHLLHGAPPVLTQEVEPNDEPKDATALTLGVPISGHIGRRVRHDTSDRDVYEVRSLTTRCNTSVEVTGVPALDLVLEGFDRDGRSLFKINDRGPGQAERLPPTEIAADQLYVVVRELWVQGTLPLENSTDAYTLTVRCGQP